MQSTLVLNRHILYLLVGLIAPMLTCHAQNLKTNGNPAQGDTTAPKFGIPKPAIPGAVLVKVIDEVTQLPLSGVQVQFTGQATFVLPTDVNGTVLLINLEEGSYTVTFSRAGYESNVILVEVLPGDIIVLASDLVTLVPKGSGSGPLLNLFLSVLDKNTSTPVADPDISLEPTVGFGPVDVGSGIYAYLAIPIVDYEVVVKAHGYADEIISISNPNLFEDRDVFMTRINPLVNLNCNGNKSLAFEGLRDAMADLFVLGLSLVTLTVISRMRS